MKLSKLGILGLISLLSYTAMVVFSLAALVLILLGAKKAGQKSLGIWAGICLAAMVIGPVGTGLLPPSVFGLFERFGTFSVVVFNAVLGMYLFVGKLESDKTREVRRFEQ